MRMEQSQSCMYGKRNKIYQFTLQNVPQVKLAQFILRDVPAQLIPRSKRRIYKGLQQTGIIFQDKFCIRSADNGTS